MDKILECQVCRSENVLPDGYCELHSAIVKLEKAEQDLADFQKRRPALEAIVKDLGR